MGICAPGVHPQPDRAVSRTEPVPAAAKTRPRQASRSAGNRPACHDGQTTTGTIPAGAGSRRRRPCRSSGRRGHPRGCGEQDVSEERRPNRPRLPFPSRRPPPARRPPAPPAGRGPPSAARHTGGRRQGCPGLGQGLPLIAPEPAPHRARGSGRISGDPLQLGDDHGHRLVVVDGRDARAPARVRRPGEVRAGGLPLRPGRRRVVDDGLKGVVRGRQSVQEPLARRLVRVAGTSIVPTPAGSGGLLRSQPQG